ncbi:Phage holin [Streptococcus oralis]|uniref:Phage holin n=1 Tax=Streptococcus oralis TaxID=1303 RepID=A0A139RN92_STROR|nr:phage holin [Streptococcus oralis]KXU16213.1 Phage holin [Streptococcus oralis]
MKRINWGVRFANKNFIMTVIPAVALVFQAFFGIFNIQLEFGELVDKILVFINVLFALLALLGVVTDPTTAGIGDSNQAMEYDKPKKG